MEKLWSQEQESENLRLRFKELKANKKVGQAKFARDNDVPGGPSMLNQHIKNHRPIGLDAAKAYARGFGCSIAEISPRLGGLLDDANRADAGRSLRVDQEPLPMTTKKLTQDELLAGYSNEALALAWLLDQVVNRLDKKAAETEASAVILGYVNKNDAKPIRKPGEH